MPEPVKIGDIVLEPMPSRKNDKCTCVEPCKMKAFHNVIEPVFESEAYMDYMKTVPVLKRISVGYFSWAGDGVPNDAHFWGKQDFLTDPQFQGDSEINYFRKTNTDLVTFLQTEGWLCLVRIRKVLRMLNDMDKYDETIESLSKKAGYPVDSWGNVFEKMHPHACKCAPCSALREVKKQLEKKSIKGQEVTQSVIHHIRRCVYRVLISGIDRIFETFCGRRFSVVWYILSEEFNDHYRDAEFEKLCSLIINDVVAIEPITSLTSFSRMILELYEGATDLARAILHKFAVILGSQKMFYTSSMNFIMFYIDSFNMIIRMLHWLENKFRVFNQLANNISNPNLEDKLDFKTLILHALNELVYRQPDVINRREAALKVIATYQKLQSSYFGPHIDNLEKYLEYIDETLNAATTIFQSAKLPCKCPTFKVPTRNVIDAALYINPYREDQFDAPQVFHCYYQDRFIIERSQTPWKILYNNKAKILLRLTVENPADKNKKLAINVFLAEENPTAEDRIKDQYFALYESRLERLVDFFDVLKQEVIEYYANTNSTVGFFEKLSRYSRKAARMGYKSNPISKAAMCRRVNANSNVTKISVPVKIKRPDKRSRYSKNNRMAILSSLMQKHKKTKLPSTIENLEQLLTFAVKTGVEGSGMLPELVGDAKDVYVSITSVDKARRQKADQEFSLHELMSFIIFWYARHGCVTEFEGHTLHRTTFGCTKTSFKESFPLLYKAAEDLDNNLGDGLLSDNDLAILEKASTGFCVTLSGSADGTAVLTAEAEARKLEQAQRKKQVLTKVPEIRNRMRKTLETRHSAEVAAANPKVTVTAAAVPKLQAKSVAEETKPANQNKTAPAQASNPVQSAKEIDVDELVQLIEGTHIKSDPNPKKAAKKARQKEKKEQERKALAEAKAREEAEKLAEEQRKKEEERKRLELEKKLREAEEQKKKDEILRKQREAAEQKKEEQRRKREELERRKAEEKKLKKEAKKQRREQRKRDQDLAEAKDSGESSKTEPSSAKPVSHKSSQPNNSSPEKEYGRLKHEKEQRKREEEEARRLQQLEAQERVQASKKSKRKKKKQKGPGDIENVTEPPPEEESKAAPVGQPLLEIFNHAATNGGDVQGKNPDEKSNLVTIKKHMDSSVTISMKGKEGERDVVYTLVNGQVYPTNNDGKASGSEALSMQQQQQQPGLARVEISKPSGTATVTMTGGNADFSSAASVPVRNAQSHGPKINLGPPMYPKEAMNVPEIDLSQLKLPPGITITKVPQNTNYSKFEGNHGHGHGLNGNHGHHAHSNGIHSAQSAEFLVKPLPPAVPEYHKSPAVGVGGFNSSVMVVDSRCSSLESQGYGGFRGSDMIYSANRTRPSSETSIASDRPSSGMDSVCINGPSSFVNRMGYASTEAVGRRVPMSMSSPFAASRNETPSPAWPNDLNHGLSGFSGVHPHSASVTPDRHGFWSSNPTSPVTFPTSAVSESYIRAQDQQFIKPRPQPRACYSNPGKVSAQFNPDNTVTFSRKAPPAPDFRPISNASGTASSFEQASLQSTHRSTPPSAIGPIGFKSVVEQSAPQHRPQEQWTPWGSNGERFSPEISAIPQAYRNPSPFTLPPDVFSQDDSSEAWEADPGERVDANRPVNPYGPIGSNISRRPSNGSNGTTTNNNNAPHAAANGHQKINEAPAAIDPSFWIYNRTF